MSFPQIVLTNMKYVETRTCISFETLVQHAIYEPHTSFIVVPFSNYIFVCTTRFFRLDLIFITAIILMSLNVFLIFLWAKNVAVSSAKMFLMSGLNSSIDPRKIQYSFSLFCFWVRRETVGHAKEDLTFCLT